LANINRFLQFLYYFNRDCSTISHITLIVRAPYFVNLNDNTFQLKTLLFFVRLRS